MEEFRPCPKHKPIVDKELLAKIRKMPCLVLDHECFGKTEAHHVTTRGAGGGDTIDNLIPLCRHHHRSLHDRPLIEFIEKHQVFYRWLNDNKREDIFETANYKRRKL